MADAVLQGLPALAAVEHGHIAAAAALVHQDLGVSGLPPLVEEPVAQHAGAVAHLLVGGVDGLLVVVLGQGAAGLIDVQDILRHLLGLVHGGSLLLVGGLDGVALVVGLGLRLAGDGDIGSVHHVVGVLVLLVVLLDLLVAVDEVLIAVLGGVLAGQYLILQAGLKTPEVMVAP